MSLQKRNLVSDLKPRVVALTANGKANSDLIQANNQLSSENMTITGDDILIEYVHRLMIAV